MIITRSIEDEAAKEQLNKIGMTLGNWHRVEYLNDSTRINNIWRQIKIPSDIKELLIFSQKLVNWLPDLNDYLITFDDSTYFDSSQLLILELIIGPDVKKAIMSGLLTIAFMTPDPEVKIRLAYFIFLCLAFGAHTYIVSSSEVEGPILAILDEGVYLISNNNSTERLRQFLEYLEIEKRPPTWVTEYGDHADE
jgi:hypothetical protein